MSFDITKWSIENLEIKDPSAKAILNSLANALNSKTGECCPSISRIVRETALSRSTVIRKINWLKNEGWISLKRDYTDNGGLKSNHYTIHQGRVQISIQKHHDTSQCIDDTSQCIDDTSQCIDDTSQCIDDTRASVMVTPLYKEDIQRNILSVSSLRSETESSVFSPSSKTDILSKARARENPEIENQQNSEMSANEQSEKQKNEPIGQNENQAWQEQKTKSPPQEPKQQRCSQAETLAISETTLGRERPQVAPPRAAGFGANSGMSGDGGGGAGSIEHYESLKEKPRIDSQEGVLMSDDVEYQTEPQNAPASQNGLEKANSQAGNRKIKYPADFEAAWKAYPTTPNMSKKEGFDQWRKIDEEDRKAVARAIPQYQKFLKSKPDHPVIHFCRFISKRRFDGFVEQAGGGSTVQGENGAQKPKSWLLGDPRKFSDEQWQKILNVSRNSLRWWRSWGAIPGQEGCLVPEHLLRKGQSGDGYLWDYDKQMDRVAA